MEWDVLRRMTNAPYTPASEKTSLETAIETAEKMVEWLWVGDRWHWETCPQEDPMVYGALVLDADPTQAALLVVPHWKVLDVNRQTC